VDLIFSPGGRLEKPVLNLKLPAHYLKEGRYGEALAEYRRILKHHPDETEAWEKAIWLESRIFGRTAAAAKLERAARRRGLRPDPGSVIGPDPDGRS
jgi:tetratricopeptide (TPR) repeat protein